MALSLKVSSQKIDAFLVNFKERINQPLSTNLSIDWTELSKGLNNNPTVLKSLVLMEQTGGAPHLVSYQKETNEVVFYDCSDESPKERRSLCYDLPAWEARKKFKPSGNAQSMAAEMGISLLTEEDYQLLQQLKPVDQKTSSWIETPQPVRDKGGAIFGDRRFGRLFIYHNGAESYYGSRGFRGKISFRL